MDYKELSKKRREYVNKEYGELLKNKRLTNKEKSKELKRIWREAKQKYKIKKSKK